MASKLVQLSSLHYSSDRAASVTPGFLLSPWTMPLVNAMIYSLSVQCPVTSACAICHYGIGPQRLMGSCHGAG